MIRPRTLSVVFAMLMSATTVTPLWAAEAYGTPFENDGFVKDDWQVVCDNTLTCRAAGYSDEDEKDKQATILITAIPQAPLPTVEVQLLPQIVGINDEVELWLNGHFYGQLQHNAENDIFRLNEKQTQSLLKQVRYKTSIEILVVTQTGSDRWQISDNGMAAVLLKLDDVQGRVGMPIALVGKNNPKRQTPKKAQPKPVIHKAFAYADDTKQQLTASQQAYFKNNIAKWIDINAPALIGSKDSMGECELINPASELSQIYKNESFDWTFTLVDANHTLASHQCWRAAYNEGYGYWVINNAKPNRPQLITTSGISYADGQIASANKGRGIGDCWSSTVWTWNGKTFIKSSEMTTGLCRGFAGGAWELPTFVSHVIQPKQQ